MRDGRSDPGRPPMATRRAAALLRGGLGLAGGRPDAPPGRSRYNRFDAFQGPPSGGPPSAFSRAIDYDADHVLRRGPLPAALSRGAFTRPPLPASAVRAAAPRSRTAVTDDQSWPSEDHRQYWQQQVATLQSMEARRSASQIDWSNCLGLPSTPAGAVQNLRGEFFQWKRADPDKVLLVQLGNFFEAVGIDAVMLMEHCTLRPMGQRLAAGFPIVGYQGRVRQILAAGLSVKMYVQQGLVGEEEAGIEDVTNSEGSNSNLSSKKATKGPVKMKRVGLRPVTRACPVIPRVRAVGGFDEDEDDVFTAMSGQWVMGLAYDASGYSVLEVDIYDRKYRESAQQTEDGVRARLARGSVSDVYLHRGSGVSSMRQDTRVSLVPPERSWHRRARDLCREYGVRTKVFDSLGEGPLGVREGLLERLLLEHDMAPSLRSTFRLGGSGVQAGRWGPRPRELYTSTAEQLGIHLTKGVPSLVDAMLPPAEGSKLARQWLARTLAVPPPEGVGKAIRDSCRLLSSLSVPLPGTIPPRKVQLQLERREATADTFRDMADMAGTIAAFDANSDTRALAERVAVPAAMEADVGDLGWGDIVNGCARASHLINQVVPPRPTPTTPFTDTPTYAPPSIAAALLDPTCSAAMRDSTNNGDVSNTDNNNIGIIDNDTVDGMGQSDELDAYGGDMEGGGLLTGEGDESGDDGGLGEGIGGGGRVKWEALLIDESTGALRYPPLMMAGGEVGRGRGGKGAGVSGGGSAGGSAGAGVSGSEGGGDTKAASSSTPPHITNPTPTTAPTITPVTPTIIPTIHVRIHSSVGAFFASNESYRNRVWPDRLPRYYANAESAAIRLLRAMGGLVMRAQAVCEEAGIDPNAMCVDFSVLHYTDVVVARVGPREGGGGGRRGAAPIPLSDKYPLRSFAGFPESLLRKHGLHSPGGKKRKASKALTTAEVEGAGEGYVAACEGAMRGVERELGELASRMSPCVPSILCASWFAVVFSALTHHVRHGLAKRWCLPEWPEEGGEEVSDRIPPIQLRGLWPYWLDPTDDIDPPVKNDVHIDRMGLITGPNMGGKSSLLRSVCAACLLARCGFLAPADAASVPGLDAFVLRNFSADNPAAGSSSFAVEMREMGEVVRDCTSRSLVLIDELGKGTDPSSGASIAAAFLEHLGNRGARGFLATHFTRDFLTLATRGGLAIDLADPLRSPVMLMQMGAAEVEGGRGDRMRSTFRLGPGVSMDSLALTVARQCGVHEDVLRRAGELRNVLMQEHEGLSPPAAPRPPSPPHAAHADSEPHIRPAPSAASASRLSKHDADDDVSAGDGKEWEVESDDGSGDLAETSPAGEAARRVGAGEVAGALVEEATASAGDVSRAPSPSAGPQAPAERGSSPVNARTLVLRRPVPLREAVGGSPPRAASSKAELAADVLRAVSSRLLGAPLSPRDLLHLRPGEEPPPQAQRNTFVYLLRRSGDGRFYCGETDNLAQRLAQHARAGGAGAGQPCEAWAVAVTGGKSKARRVEALAIQELRRAGVEVVGGDDALNRSFGSAG